MHDYFLDSLLITTTSRTTTTTPITVQIHIPPPAHPPIHPLVWFIIKSLLLFLFAVGVRQVPISAMLKKRSETLSGSLARRFPAGQIRYSAGNTMWKFALFSFHARCRAGSLLHYATHGV